MLVAEQEWDDHLNSLSSLRLSTGAHSLEKAPITLRAGCSSLRISDPPNHKTNAVEQPECKGEKVDLFLRLGLLRLVCEIEGLTVETLPETLRLNFSRLRAVQAFLQKIIVICTSILVLRQTLLAECLVTNPSDMEDIASKSVTKLFKLLDNVEDAGITEVVETLNLCLEGDEPEKLQVRKEIMANVLAKSLRAGDGIFTRVSWQKSNFTLRKRSRGQAISGEHPETCWCHSTHWKASWGYGRSVGCGNCVSQSTWFMVSRAA